MGKRSDFEKVPQDKYNTPAPATWPLFNFLPVGPVRYTEPCAGRGDLIRHLLEDGIECALACDIAPQSRLSPVRIIKRDALRITAAHLAAAGSRLVITNPPWTREILHAIIRHFLGICPAWYLFDADWMHTKQAAELLMRCARIVPVGRVKWMPGSEHTGKDNCCWYFFPPNHVEGPRVAPRN